MANESEVQLEPVIHLTDFELAKTLRDHVAQINHVIKEMDRRIIRAQLEISIRGGNRLSVVEVVKRL